MTDELIYKESLRGLFLADPSTTLGVTVLLTIRSGFSRELSR